MLVILILSCAFFEVCLGAVWLEEGNPLENQKISVKLLSPENKSFAPGCSLILRETDADNICVTVSVGTMALLWQDSNIETWLTIDDQPQVKLNRSKLDDLSSAAGAMWTSEYNSTLSGLSEGAHMLKIRVLSTGNYYEGSVLFTIDNTGPTIDISIKNAIYFENDLKLTCITNEPFSWIAYSLDNQVNVTIKTNSNYDYALDNPINGTTQADTNLTDLTEGSHSLTIYANDTAGNMVASQTITFTVDKLEPFRTAIIIAVVLTGVVVLAAVSLLAHRRHKLNRKLA